MKGDRAFWQATLAVAHRHSG